MFYVRKGDLSSLDTLKHPWDADPWIEDEKLYTIFEICRRKPPLTDNAWLGILPCDYAKRKREPDFQLHLVASTQRCISFPHNNADKLVAVHNWMLLCSCYYLANLSFLVPLCFCAIQAHRYSNIILYKSLTRTVVEQVSLKSINRTD